MYIKKQYVFNKTPVFGWVLVNDSDRKNLLYTIYPYLLFLLLSFLYLISFLLTDVENIDELYPIIESYSNLKQNVISSET